jgi:hypothetical protein
MCRGGTSCFIWMRAISVVVVALLFLGTVAWAFRSENSYVLLTDGNDCAVVTGNPSDFVITRGQNRECFGENAVIFVAQPLVRERIIYQNGDGLMYCLTDGCVGKRATCGSRVTLTPCVEYQVNQYWTALRNTSKIASAAALDCKEEMRECLSFPAPNSFSKGSANNDLLRMEECRQTKTKHQDWRFVGAHGFAVSGSVSGSMSGGLGMAATVS